MAKASMWLVAVVAAVFSAASVSGVRTGNIFADDLQMPLRGSHYDPQCNQQGRFDYYTYALNWMPSFCYNATTNENNWAACKSDLPVWLTVHGLWPSFKPSSNCSYDSPNTCTTTAFDYNLFFESNNTGVLATLEQYWLNIKNNVPGPNPDYEWLWNHEWGKHGVCTEMAQLEYFTKAVEMRVNFDVPRSITNNAGRNSTAENINSELGGLAIVQCTAPTPRSGGLPEFSGLEMCVEVLADGRPGSFLNCAPLSGSRSCKGDIYVPDFSL